jgi:cell division protein FtsB
MQGVRHHKESFFHTRFWIVVLLGICVMLTAAVIKMSRKYIHAKSIRDDYHKELVQNQGHEADLEKNINALSTDRGKEEEIRDRYRVVKQGEQMILIIDNDKQDEAQAEPEKIGIFRSIGNFFKRLFHKNSP